MSDKYVRVTCILIARPVNADAILVDINPPEDPQVKQTWIPFSLIHGADERRLGDTHATDEISFRLMEWKAKELGL